MPIATLFNKEAQHTRQNDKHTITYGRQQKDREREGYCIFSNNKSGKKIIAS